MSKLTRVTHTIFGGSAPAAANGIAQFGSKQAGTPTYTTNIATLQALAAWLNGWGSAVVSGKVPPLEELNAAFLEPSYQIGYMLEMGIPEYDAGTTYYTNSICQSGGLIYQSLVDNNIGNAPASSPTDWKLYIPGVPNIWGGTAVNSSGLMALTISNFPNPLPTGTILSFITPSVYPSGSISINSGSVTGNIIDAFGNQIYGYIQSNQTISVVYNGTNFILISSTPSPFSNILSTSGIGSDQNNYNPGTGWVPTVGQLNLLPTAANVNITGLVALQAGTEIIIQNIAVSDTVTLKNQSSSSSAANRFITYNGSDYVIPAQGFVFAVYTGSRWLIGI
ncbi:MAG: hypothetical protein KGJ90_06880 [Patescibacteria group bacterium]|nr:hypothetical protein [Patescibacteria group bacterium]